MDSWLETKQLPAHLIAAGGLVYRDDKVLLIRSERRGWEFPGGVIEQGEPIIEGLKREIMEEARVIAQPVILVGIYQNLALKEGYGPLEGTTLPPTVNFDFICSYVSGEGSQARSGESLEAAWFTPEEAIKLVKFPGYVERLSNMLRFDGKPRFATFKKSGEQLCEYRQIALNES